MTSVLTIKFFAVPCSFFKNLQHSPLLPFSFPNDNNEIKEDIKVHISFLWDHSKMKYRPEKYNTSEHGTITWRNVYFFLKAQRREFLYRKRLHPREDSHHFYINVTRVAFIRHGNAIL